MPQVQPQQQPIMMPQMWGRPQQIPGPQQSQQMAGQTPFVTRQELMEQREKEKEESRMEKLEGRISQLDKDFAGALERFTEQITERIEKVKPEEKREQMVRVQEPVLDAQGRPVVDKDGKLVTRTVTGPASQVTGESELDKLLKYQKVLNPKQKSEISLEDVRRVVKEETKPEALTPEKVREIVRKEGKPEKSELTTRLEQRLDASEERYEELKDRMEAEDRKRLEDTISDLRNRLDSMIMGGGPGEWKSDEVRLLASTIDRLGSVLEKKKPVETLKDVLIPKGMPPAAREVPPKTRSGILGALEKRGMVVEK